MAKHFKTLEEIREYLSGDEIICLECGKGFKNLSKHVYVGHGFSVKEYKEKYNIPISYSLIIKSIREERSKNKKALMKKYPHVLEILRAPKKNNLKRPSKSVCKMTAINANKKKVEKREKDLQPIFKKIIELTLQDVSLNEMKVIPGMPKSRSIKLWRDIYPSFEEMLQNAIPKMSLKQKMRLNIISREELYDLVRPHLKKEEWTYNSVAKGIGTNFNMAKKLTLEVLSKEKNDSCNNRQA